MKYIITENRLKNLIKKQFGLDLTGKIEMITSRYQIPFEFDNVFSSNSFSRMMNLYGPMYLIRYGKKMFLTQPIKNGKWMIADPNSNYKTEEELFEELGLPHFISIRDLIDAFFNETEDLNESTEPNYTNVLRKFVGSKNYKGVNKVEIAYDKGLKQYIILVSFEDEFSYPRFVNDTLWDIEESIKDWLPDVKVSMYRKY